MKSNKENQVLKSSSTRKTILSVTTKAEFYQFEIWVAIESESPWNWIGDIGI